MGLTALTPGPWRTSLDDVTRPARREEPAVSPKNPLSGTAQRAARWSAENPWRAILAWAALVAFAVGCAVMVPTTGVDDAEYRRGESGRAAAMIEEAGLDQPPGESVLITADGTLAADRARAAAGQVADQMRQVDGVTGVGEPQWSPDRSAVLLPVQLARDHENAAPLLAVTDRAAEAYPDLEIAQTGDLTVDDAIDEAVEADLRTAEGISLPVTLVLMLLVFGALVAAGLPVLLGATSVAATIGLIAPLSHLVHADASVSSMIVLIGMAVGVDYSLFYLKREREERANGHGTLDAVEIAARTSGHSVVVSGLAVISCMAGLFLVTDVTFNSLAVGAILVVAIAVLGSITVLPALLVKLGRWVDRPRVPFLWRLTGRIGRGGISHRVLGPVVRRPLAALLVSVALVGGLSAPALSMKLHTSGMETLPQDIEEVQTMRTISEEFPGEGPVAEVVARGDEATAGLERVEAAALRTDHFEAVGGRAIRTSADGRTAVLSLGMPYEEADAEVDQAIEELREELVPAAFDGTEAETAVGGAARTYDQVQHLSDRLPLVVGFVLLLTMTMMGVAFRSVPVALVSCLLNLLSVGVAFGLMTMTFQLGWGAGLLGFDAPGYLIDWLPLFVMVVLVGLSMDYHVFVLSRVREHVAAGLPARAAVRRGIADTAGVVTSAAAVMVSVFAIFAAMSLMEMKMMGVGLSAAILVDATLIRLVMLPAILSLLGERAWGRRNRAPASRSADRGQVDPGATVRIGG